MRSTVENQYNLFIVENMWITRGLVIIISLLVFGASFHLILGGALWIWLVGAWALSGPVIIIDAASMSADNDQVAKLKATPQPAHDRRRVSRPHLG